VTWHHYYVAGSGSPVDPSIFLESSTYDSYETRVAEMEPKYDAYVKSCAGTSAKPALWMGEAAGVGGGTSNSESVIGKFIGIFWTADKLGVAARSGHSVVARQEWGELTTGGELAPELWIGLLWKRLMGLEVLQTTPHDLTSYVRTYVHRDSSTGKVTVVLINFGKWDAKVSDLSFLNSSPSKPQGHRDEYHMTSPDEGYEGTRVALNGDVLADTFSDLELDEDGNIPDFDPLVVSNSEPINVKSMSVVFVCVTSGSEEGPTKGPTRAPTAAPSTTPLPTTATTTQYSPLDFDEKVMGRYQCLRC
jgi:hypothetical protein